MTAGPAACHPNAASSLRVRYAIHRFLESRLAARRSRCAALERELYTTRGWVHPYQHLRQAAIRRLAPGRILVEVGCGRRFDEARHYRATGALSIGVDPNACGQHTACAASLLVRGDGASLPLPDGSADVIVLRSVMEHLREPDDFIVEWRRVLRPNGVVLCLTPNRHDIASTIARLVPNRLHPAIVRLAEGRAEGETYPTCYRANTRRDLLDLASRHRLRLARLEYLTHCPSYLTFSPALYRVAAGISRHMANWPAAERFRSWIFAEFKPAA